MQRPVTFLLALLLLTTVVPAQAQTSTARLSGRISDSSGAAVPGASVVVTSESTRLTRTVQSNEVGEYSVPALSPGSGALTDIRAQNLTLAEIHTFSSAIVNEFRAGFSRLRLERVGENAYKKDVVTELGIPGVQFGGPEGWGIPSVTITGYTVIGDDNFFLPFLLRDNTFHFVDTLSIHRGSHTIKTGVELRHFQFNVLQEFTPRGDFRFTSKGLTADSAGTDPADRTGSEFAAFLLGLPSQQRRTVGIVPSYLRQSATSAFLQDDWKVSRQLTLNLGLRYELVPPYVDKYDRLANLQFPAGSNPIIITPYTPGVPRGLTETDWNNFSPRFGFALKPSSRNQMPDPTCGTVSSRASSSSFHLAAGAVS